MTAVRRLPPVWLMGFCNFLQGANGAVMLIAVPQLLAAMRVPEPRISLIVGIGLLPSVTSFVFSPILDWRISRRSYAILLAALAALFQLLALAFIRDLFWLTVFLFLTYTAVMLYVAATGGWLAGLTGVDEKNRLGAWLTVWNVGGGGVVALFAVTLLRDLPFVVGASILSLILLAPLPLFLWLPAVSPDGRLARESFRDFLRDLAGLLRKPDILWTLLLFTMPAASFSLTNMLAGLGDDFSASEQTVSAIGGVGIIVAGIVGSLLVPVFLKRLHPRKVYLLIGSLGGVFTLSLILAPRIPATFAVAMVGENAFQAAAFAVEGAIMLRGIGNSNPFAATQFALLNAASSLPIAYMQIVDGQAYGAHGLTGSLVADGMLSLAACGILAVLVLRRLL
jgi:MFS transporter, PAT family, beta-lactamase induction signal transducer AmpG